MRWWLRISVCHLVRVRPRLWISCTQSSRHPVMALSNSRRASAGSLVRYTSRTDSLASHAPITSPSGSPARRPSSTRSVPCWSRRSTPLSMSLRIRYRGSPLRPRCSKVSFRGSPSYFVQTSVSDAYHMKRISHTSGVIETTTQSFTVRLGEVRCYDTDTGKPLRGACVEPFTQVSTGIAPDKVDHDPTDPDRRYQLRNG